MLFLLSIFLIVGVIPVQSQTPVANARQLVQQAEVEYRARDLVSAVNYLEEAVKLFESQEDWQNLGITLTNLGRLQLSLGKAELALSSWQKATEISEQLNDESAMARDRIYQAEALQQLGLYDRVCVTLQSALALDSNSCADLSVQTLENKIKLASPLQVNGWRSLGNVLRLLGKLEESELVLQTIAQSPSDTEPAATITSLGNTLRARGNIIRDRTSSPKYDYLPWRCDQQSSEFGIRNSELGYKPYPKVPPKEYTSIYPLGQTKNSELERSDVDEIEPHTKNPPPEAQNLYLHAQQQYSKAIALSASRNTKISAQLNLLDLILEGTERNIQQQTLANNLIAEIDLSNLAIDRANIYAQIKLAKSQTCLAGLQNNLTDWQKTEQILLQAQQNAQSIANPALESYALGNLGGFYEYRGWWLDNMNSEFGVRSSEYFAEKSHAKGIQKQREKESNRQPLSEICQTAQDCRQKAIALTSDALLLAQPDKSPQIAYQWQWQLGRLWAAQEKRGRAIAFYQAASKTLESVRSDLINLNSDVQFSFRDAVEPLYRQLIDLLLTTEDNFPTQALKVVDFLRLSELENFLQCSLAPQLQIETAVGEIDPQAAFIYPLILADRLEIIYKLPQQPLAHRAVAIPPKEVEQTVAKLQSYLRQSRFTEEVKQEAQNVYQWIIQPLEPDLEQLRQSGQVSTLVFVLDDTLRDIPLSVLYNQGKYLIEDYALAVIPNRQLFDPRPRQQQTKVLTAGVSEAQTVDGIEFAALPYVSSELADIQQLTDTTSEPLLNQTFTEERLEQQIDSAAFSIVHIATHGEFNSDPDETYLLVWGQRVKVRDFDRLLQINNPDTSQAIELLILSACETAQGDRRAALGLAGVAAQARVRTTLASLWKVNDLATAEFMTKFYENLRDGATVAQALQQTQLYFLNDPDLRRPYFWSPFVIVGNWL